MTVFPSLSAVGSWDEVLLFSIDFTVSQNFLEFVLQDANFCLKKLAFVFLAACVYWFLTSLKSCISSISFQDTRARSIRKACSLKCFREHLTVMRGGRLTAEQ